MVYLLVCAGVPRVPCLWPVTGLPAVQLIEPIQTVTYTASYEVSSEYV